MSRWIKWTCGLATRREVLTLASTLDRDRHEIAGRLMSLWEWLDLNAADADVDEMSQDVSLILGDKAANLLDAVSGLPGLAAAMASPAVGWLIIEPDGRVVFPRFARHNGTTAKARAYEAQRKSNQRSRRQHPGQLSQHDRDNNRDTDRDNNRDQRREEKIDHPADDLPPTSPPGGTSAKKPPGYTANFERFFAAYPRREGKAKAFEVWNRVCKRIMAERELSREQVVEFLIAKCVEFARSPRGQSDYRPHPATWLNQGRYDDDPSEWHRIERPGGSGGTQLDRAEARERKQLDALAEWAAEHEVQDVLS